VTLKSTKNGQDLLHAKIAVNHKNYGDFKVKLYSVSPLESASLQQSFFHFQYEN